MKDRASSSEGGRNAWSFLFFFHDVGWWLSLNQSSVIIRIKMTLLTNFRRFYKYQTIGYLITWINLTFFCLFHPFTCKCSSPVEVYKIILSENIFEIVLKCLTYLMRPSPCRRRDARNTSGQSICPTCSRCWGRASATRITPFGMPRSTCSARNGGRIIEALGTMWCGCGRPVPDVTFQTINFSNYTKWFSFINSWPWESVLRIRDVYPGSWFLRIPDPGSKNICCHTFFVAPNFTKL